MKLYHAMIWESDARPGQRVTVMAEDLTEARQKLEAEYGTGTVFDLHNKEDAEKPR
jgi:hypothetical protein